MGVNFVICKWQNSCKNGRQNLKNSAQNCIKFVEYDDKKMKFVWKLVRMKSLVSSECHDFCENVAQNGRTNFTNLYNMIIIKHWTISKLLTAVG